MAKGGGAVALTGAAALRRGSGQALARDSAGGDAAIDGGGRMCVRDAHSSDIAAAQDELFFTTLAQTCNVVRAAKAAGFDTSWAYRRRKREAGFRANWARAVREGYQMLELVLLERALKGTPKRVVGSDGATRVMREYSTPLAVALLRRHADTADSAEFALDESEMGEVRARILERLGRLKLREEGAEREAPVEIKSVLDRVAVLVWALRHGSGQALRHGSGQALRHGSGQALRHGSGQALGQGSGQAAKRSDARARKNPSTSESSFDGPPPRAIAGKNTPPPSPRSRGWSPSLRLRGEE